MGKRANNEGSIYRRTNDGRWVAAVQLGRRTGRRAVRCHARRIIVECRSCHVKHGAGERQNVRRPDHRS